MKCRTTLSAVVLSICGHLPTAGAAPQEFQIRLLTPLASYTKAGTPFEAKVIGSTSAPRPSGLPPGARIFGSVVTAKATGLGFRRERALLELGFERCELPTGEEIVCTVELTSVDNAREHMKDGQIRGILAASHPNSFLNGVWYRPGLTSIPRAAMGLTGAGGMISSNFIPGATGAPIVIVAHMLLFRMPEPEIELPSGTDLIVQIDAQVEPQIEAVTEDQIFSTELLDRMAAISPLVTNADDAGVADLLNVALIGDSDQVTQAFEDAGWSGTDARDKNSVMRTYAAYAGKKPYATAPVSALYNRGFLPDLVFQKSFNTTARRHHIRLWEVEVPGEGTAWIGAASQDTNITYNLWRMSLSHRIDPLIDRERIMLINDLAAAGCLASVRNVERPDLSQLSRITEMATTDGALSIAAIQACTSPAPEPVAPVKPHRSFGAKMLRQVVLDTRHYVTRGNAYYWIYSGLRHLHSSRKSAGEDDGDVTSNTAENRAKKPAANAFRPSD